ncbi:hypothetical protein [Chitinophaga deserti]|uniref:hypothetical protein n=1 Tax=Chitinophaga deserti TaxID=2164099 RepID=UPI000D6C11B3|nr:hypothetical protein [Chitinophaga deserti]
MKFIKNIFATVLLCCLCGGAFAQEQEQEQYQDYFKVTAKADTTRIRIGEPVKVNLTAKVMLYALKGANIKVIFPNIPDSANHIEIVERSQLDTTGTDENQKIWRQAVTFTSFDSGRWELPPMKFEVYSVTDGSYDSVFTDPIFIDVSTVAVDTTKAFKPIKPLRVVKFNWLDYWFYFLGGFLLITLIVLYFTMWRNRKKAPKPIAVVPAKPPFELALEALAKLEKEQPWQTDVKGYYTELTGVLRTYFEQQFNIPALEQTTAELMNDIKPVTILNQQRNEIYSILSLADLAKFAKLQPTPQEHEDTLRKAVAVVEWTRASAMPKTELPVNGTNQ